MEAVRVLLADKRTSLAAFRTGMTVIALPLSIVTALIATSRFYDALDVLHLLVPVLALSAFLMGVGFYLIGHAFFRLHRFNKKIRKIEDRDTLIRELMEEP